MNREPVFDGGHLALDFLNTAASPDGRRRDHLASPEAMLGWLHAAGLAEEQALRSLRRSPPDARILLGRAVRLRTAVSAMTHALLEGVRVPAHAIAEVNAILPLRRVGVRLDSGRDLGSGLESSPTHEAPGYRLVRTATPDGVLGLLSPVAEAAARLLVEADPARVRRCPAPGCALWFLDTSRNGRRRWCSMSRCGNRAKVAAHYRRHRS